MLDNFHIAAFILFAPCLTLFRYLFLFVMETTYPTLIYYFVIIRFYFDHMIVIVLQPIVSDVRNQWSRKYILAFQC